MDRAPLHHKIGPRQAGRGSGNAHRAVVVAVVVSLLLSGCGADAASDPESTLGTSFNTRLAESDSPTLGSGMASAEYELVDAITQQFGDDASFSGFEWEADSGTLILWWFGAVSPGLADALESSPKPIDVRATVHAPGLLRDAAAALITPGAVPGVQVWAVGPTIDGARLNVIAEFEGSMAIDQARAALELAAGFPVNVEVGSVTGL